MRPKYVKRCFEHTLPFSLKDLGFRPLILSKNYKTHDWTIRRIVDERASSLSIDSLLGLGSRRFSGDGRRLWASVVVSAEADALDIVRIG